MTEAYVTGFCKTAEEYGVDPTHLMKVAEELEKEAVSLGDFREILNFIPKDHKVISRAINHARNGIRQVGRYMSNGYNTANRFMMRNQLGTLAGGSAIGYGLARKANNNENSNTRYIPPLERLAINIGQRIRRAITPDNNNNADSNPEYLKYLKYMSPLSNMARRGANIGQGIGQRIRRAITPDNNANNNTGDTKYNTDFGAVD